MVFLKNSLYYVCISLDTGMKYIKFDFSFLFAQIRFMKVLLFGIEIAGFFISDWGEKDG